MNDFFQAPPPRPDAGRDARPVWAAPPRGIVPAVVPVEAVMARNDLVGVFLDSLHVYPAGFEIAVHVVAREGSYLDPFSNRRDRRAEDGGEIPPGRLRLGFAFADGSEATNTSEGPFGTREGGAPSSPLMMRRSGRGDEAQWSQTYWVWPLPPPGRLEFLCRWPAAGLPFSRTEIDAATIIAAASRAKPVFAD
jgi:hypothetical protein